MLGCFSDAAALNRYGDKIPSLREPPGSFCLPHYEAACKPLLSVYLNASGTSAQDLGRLSAIYNAYLLRASIAPRKAVP